MTVPGADADDVRQEALIALWIATGDYDPSHGVTFPTFARYVVRRRLASVLKMALREKHRPLNESVREVERDGEWVSVVDTLPGGLDPLRVAVDRDRLARIVGALELLTPYERASLARVLNGVESNKLVHNAAWRARRKLKAVAA